MKPVKLTPYDYQKEAVIKFEEWWTDETSLEALIALTMGLGKTVTAALCITRLLELLPKTKILWLTHREELIEQSKGEIELYTGQDREVERADAHSTGLAQIIVASVPTLRGKRLEKFARHFQPDLIVADEAHHALAITWMQIKQTFSKAKVLNLTATPYRADIANRLDLGKVLIERNTSDGIRMGVLVPPKPVGKLEIDLGSVKKRLGDYETNSLAELLCHQDILDGCVRLIKEHAPGHKTILFAASVGHGRALAALLREKGFRVGEVYGETPTDERKRYYKGIESGTLDVLINNLCLTEGFNLPALDLVVMLRPTRSASLYLQCVGRGLRKDRNNPNKKHCLIIDIVDTAKRTGGEELPLPNEDDQRVYSAINGRQASLPEIFLNWFYKADDVQRVIFKDITVDQCSRLDSPAKLNSLLLPPWLQAIPGAIPPESFARVWTPEGEYSDLFKPIRTTDPAAFQLLIGRKGWLYFPHGKLPTDDDALEEAGQAIGYQELSDEENYTINTLISRDAQLRNFILDLFDPNQSLKQQAAKCFERFPVGPLNRQIAWFKVIYDVETKFHFIQWKDPVAKTNRLLVRAENGRMYHFQQEGFRRLEHQPGLAIRHEDLPDFVKGTAWANQIMSEKQAQHVCKILSVAPSEAASMRISKLSASALMSNQWNRAHLLNIGKMLKSDPSLQPVVYEETAPNLIDFPKPTGQQELLTANQN